MSAIDHKAQAFVNRWRRRGSENQDTQHFWNDFLQNVMGVSSTNLPTFIDYERPVGGYDSNGIPRSRKADAYIPTHRVLIEQKSIDIDLDKKRDNGIWGQETPFEQARWYCNHMAKGARPDWIIISNFASFRIYTLDEELPEDHFIEVALDELPVNLNVFGFIRDESSTRIYKEQQLSVEAGRLVSELYKTLEAEYRNLSNSPEERKDLNLLITRIVFLLYAEDAGLLPTLTAFSDYCDGPVSEIKHKLMDIFKVIDTPLTERDALYIDPLLQNWPYINGGLFHDDSSCEITIPWINNTKVRDAILDASRFDWSGINPTIFGALFESTLNPKTNSGGGLHYTSIENIHRVIDPLFLNGLKDELARAKALPSVKNRKLALNRLHDKIASIRILDPACGSGNFLTESYLQLRSLENRIISLLLKDGVSAPSDDDLIKVTIDHFYGIEINDFAVSVAKTALWISEQQALDETISLVPDIDVDYLPLKSANRIVRANAFEINWEDLLPSSNCSYIIGNPEFCGAKKRSDSQRADMERVFGKNGNAIAVDYCSAWFLKAAEYMSTGCRAALVATDSICQGEQVSRVWEPLFSQSIHIDFAHNTFRWNNEAADQAHVFCVVIGFSREPVAKELYIHDTPDSKAKISHPKQINAYLRNAQNILVFPRRKPICSVPEMRSGNKPIDDNNYLFTSQEKDEFIQNEPQAADYFRPYIGGDEILNGFTRWCLWLGDVPEDTLLKLPLCKERVDNVRRFRLASSAASTRRLADKPTRFHVEVMPDDNSVIIPETSSEFRRYIPIGFAGPETLCSNQLRLIPGASLYHFGVLQSQFHQAWMKAVAGRHEGRYRYSKSIVYNNFIWPNPNDQEKARIEEAAKAVLLARQSHSDTSLGELYSQISFEFDHTSQATRNSRQQQLDDLIKAHNDLDDAVEQAYQVSFQGDEDIILNYLFKKYDEYQHAGQLS